MSALCSCCVHHVAVNGEAVNSNVFGREYKMCFLIDISLNNIYNIFSTFLQRVLGEHICGRRSGRGLHTASEAG